MSLLGGPGGSFGGPWVDLGAIGGAFLGHFDDFFGIGWIFENLCFTIVKPCFLRSGRVLDRDFFVLRFWICAFRCFLIEFGRFVGPQGAHRVPNGSLLGVLERQISAQFGTLVASSFQSGSQAPKRSHFGSLWGVFWEYFGYVFA